MVTLKTSAELGKMRKAGAVTAEALAVGAAAVRPGITTAEINSLIHKFIVSKGATPSFLGFGGFPGSACVSVNDEVIHGIPGKRVIREGDIVSIDVGAIVNGYHGDTAATFAAGQIDSAVQALLDATKESLMAAIAAAQPGARLGDVGYAVQSYVQARGFSVVRDYVGHGIGREMHEEPEVPNYGIPGHGIRLVPGMVIAIEPMINLGTAAIHVLKDEWTVVTNDHLPSAHFEHTIAITKNGPVIMTLPTAI